MCDKILKTENQIAFKAGILYIIAELFTRGISFFMTPIFTRLLPASVFADVKIFESWTYLFAPIVSFSLYQSISRAKFDFNESYEKYISSIIAFMLFVTGAVGSILLIFRYTISDLLGFSNGLIILMLIYCFAYNSIQCVQIGERQLMHYRTNIALTILAVVPAVIASVYCVVKYRNQISQEQLLNLRIFSFYAPTTLLGIIVATIAMIRGKSIYNLKYWKYAIKYSTPMMLFSISTQVLYQADKIMVRYLCGTNATANFALATTVGYIMDILIHAIDNAWRPWLFENLNAKRYKSIRTIWTCLFILIGILTWIMTIIAPELILFLGGNGYEESVWLICPIICGSLANFIMITYTAIEQFDKKVTYSGYISIFVVVLNLSLNFIFIEKFGYISAAYTTLISYLVAAVLHSFFVERNERRDVLSIRNTFIIWLIVLAVCVLSMTLYGRPLWLRWGVAFITLILSCIMLKKPIKMLLLTFKIKI